MKRFWDKVDKRGPDECWEWRGYVRHDGYGDVGVNRKLVRAHRLAWILTRGDIRRYALVCHKCDNRLCCNPDHLFLGDHRDNAEDMVNKGRESGKLTHQQRLDIRANYLLCRVTQTELAKRFGVSQQAISSLTKGIRR